MQTVRVLNIEKELSIMFGIGPSANYICSNEVMCVFEHSKRPTSHRQLSIMSMPNEDLRWTVIPLEDTCESCQEHTHLHGCRLLRVEKLKSREGNQSRIRFWPKIDFREDEQLQYVLLQGDCGCFTSNGAAIITWDLKNEDTSKCTVYIYRTEDLHHQCLDAADGVCTPHVSFQLGMGMVLHHAQLIPSQSPEDGEMGRSLVVMCEVPWTTCAKIFVIDLKEGSYDVEIDTSCDYEEIENAGGHAQSSLNERSPFMLSPDGQWIHFRHQGSPLGTICSLEHRNITYDITHDVHVGTMVASFKFDPTGRMLTAQLEGGLVICVPPQLQSEMEPRKWPVNTHDNGFRTLEFIRRYDPALYDQFLSSDLGQEDILQSDLFQWLMSDGTLDIFIDAIGEIGVHQVKHIVFSETVLAMVLSGDPVRVLFWKLEDVKHSNRLKVEDCLHCWHGMHAVNDDPDSSMAVFCPHPQSQQDFVLIHKDHHGVYIRWLETERFQSMAVKRLWMKHVNRFRRIWVTHSGKIRILQSDGAAKSYDLAHRSECDTSSVSGLVDTGLLREATMDWNFIHEGREGYVLGWDFTNNRLITSPWEFGQQDNEVALLCDVGRVLWTNATRALVTPSQEPSEDLSVIVFDISEKIAEITGEDVTSLDTCHTSSFKETNVLMPSEDSEKLRAFIGRLLYAWRKVLPNPEHLHILGVQQNSNLLNRFVKQFGSHLVNAKVGEKSMTLMHQAIIEEDTPSVTLLWNLAQEHSMSADVDWGDADVLQWAIQQQRQRCTDVAFEKLLSSSCSVMDTARLFKKHMKDLIDNCRVILERAILDGVLCHSFGVFSVPVDLFQQSTFGIIFHTCSNVLHWKSSSNNETRWYWRRMSDGIHQQLTSASGTKILAESKFIAIEDVAQVGMRGIIRPLLMGHLSIELFSTDLVKWIIQYKWENCWRARFLKAMAMYALLLMCFSSYACFIALLDEKFQGDVWIHIISLISLFICFCISLFDVLGEIRQLKRYSRDLPQGWKYYFSLPWNWIELASELLILILIPSLHLSAWRHHDADITVSVYGLSAFECILLWFKVLYYAQPFQSTGPLVAMIRKIIYNIMIFLLLMFIVMIGFSFGFFLLFQSIPDRPESFGSLSKSFETLFIANLGDFDIEVYHSAGGLSWLAIIWFSLYMIIQAIVFLNLLIAIMGDTYDKVKVTEWAELMKCRAIVIDDGEAAMTDEEIQNMESQIGKYLHVLMPLDKHAVSTGDNVWQGRIHAMEIRIRHAMAEREGRVSRMMREVLQQNQGLEAELVQLRSQQLESIQKNAEESRRLHEQLEELKAILDRK